ncbi:MAG: T9SS type A sorting domain-containing protein [Bacteroidia bacterium]|nr:T9SS type A sorting domain-containing protein [Bacteroidia bacterium]
MPVKYPSALTRGMMLGCFFFVFCYILTGQSFRSFPLSAEIRFNPEGIHPSAIFHPQTSPASPVFPATEAMWETQFVYNPSDSFLLGGPFSGLAGAVWTGSEFWVSSWNSDTLLRISQGGNILEAFKIQGLSNVRSLTWDGNLIYASNTSAVIRGIDPVNKTIVQTISVAGGKNARFAAYDSLADNGNGGFFIGDFGTDILLISRTGQPLDTLPFSTHGRITIYGAAVDRISPGGPFLWVFDQPESPSYAVISQLKLPEGIYTGFSRDIDAQLNAGIGAAGGLFIANDILPGKKTLGGLIQDNNGPDLLFGLDLDYVSRETDAALSEFSFTPRYTHIPLPHAEYAFTGTAYNSGDSVLQFLSVDLTISDSSGAPVFYDIVGFPAVSAYQPSAFFFSGWIPGEVGLFAATAHTGTGSQTDLYTDNDSLRLNLSVTDSLYARDDNLILAGLSIASAGSQKTILGQNFFLREKDYLTSVTFSLREPTPGVPVFASIYAVDSITGRPDHTKVLGQTITYLTTTDDAINGVTLTLPMDSTPVYLDSGMFFVGVNQKGGTSLSLGLTFDKFTPGQIWLRSDALNSGSWLNIEDLGLPLVFALRPSFGPCFPTYMTAGVSVTGDMGAGNGTATATVTGASGIYSYQWNDPFLQTTPTALNLEGGQTYSCTITDSLGCQLTITSDTIPIQTGIRDYYRAGILSAQIFPNPSSSGFFLKIVMQQPEGVNVELYDAGGRMIFQEKRTNLSVYEENISLKGHPKGVYLLKLNTEKGRVSCIVLNH